MNEPKQNLRSCEFCWNHVFCIHDNWGNVRPEYKEIVDEFFETDKYLKNKDLFLPQCPNALSHQNSGQDGSCSLCTPTKCPLCASKLIKLQGKGKKPFMGCSNFNKTKCPYKRMFKAIDKESEQKPATNQLPNPAPKKDFDALDAIIIPKATFEKILRAGSKVDRLLPLYCMYLWAARWQKTNQPWATAKYISKHLGWSRETVSKYNKVLKKLNLIEDVQDRDAKTGRLRKRYIRLKYIIKRSTINSVPP